MAEGEVRFDGRAVVVTGGGRGLGRTQALVLAERGASVVVADNGTAMDGESPDSAPAHTVVAEIAAAGGRAIACTADLSVEEGAIAAVASRSSTIRLRWAMPSWFIGRRSAVPSTAGWV